MSNHLPDPIVVRREKMRQNMLAVLAIPEGREFFEQLMADCGVTRPIFSRDPIEISFNEGKRHVAMSYLQILGKSDPLSLAQLLSERDTTKQNNHE